MHLTELSTIQLNKRDTLLTIKFLDGNIEGTLTDAFHTGDDLGQIIHQLNRLAYTLTRLQQGGNDVSVPSQLG